MAKALERRQLKNVDDLFGLNGEDTATEVNLMVVDLDVSSLVPFDGHPFYLYEGERLEDMVESIRTNGVLVPILVRKNPNANKTNSANNLADYEILAGHNRVNAVKIIGRVVIRGIILENVSDEQALAIVIETNLLQRSFADMKHSEKAAVIAMHHAKMFSPGKRHDILRILQQMENADGQTEQEENPDKAHETDNGVTFPQIGERLEQEATDEPDEDEISHTDKKIADMYSLSKNTVSRYLRINQLYTPLKEMLDIGYVPFIPAVTVSFLKDVEQIMLADYLDEGIGRLDLKKAELMREHSKKGKLDRKAIHDILSGQALPTKQKAPAIKVSNDVYSRYFNKGQSAKEVQSIVEEALALYFENQD